jgi:hypothetical protein
VATTVIQLITQICLGCKFWQQHYKIAVHHVGKWQLPLMLYLLDATTSISMSHVPKWLNLEQSSTSGAW